MYNLIFKTAYLSLIRRKIRTILVILMIATSLWGLLFMQGIYEGMTEQMITNAIKSDSGHLSIYAKDFRKEKSLELEMIDTKNIENIIKKEKHIKSYTKRVLTNGLIATANYSRATQIYGIDLKSEKIHSSLDSYLKDGTYSFGKKNNGAIIGFKLAKKLKLKIGKKIILTSQDIDNEVTSISLKVKAIIKTSNVPIDEMGIFININKAKEFLNIKGVHQLSIIFNDEKDIVSFQDNLNTRLKNQTKQYLILRWDQLYPALFQGRVMMEQFSFISYALVFFTATIGIFGVILVSVLERLREFGILRAIGTKFSILAQIIFLESFIIGIIGFILGSILGGVTLYYFSIYGLDLSSFSDALDEFGMDAITYAVIKTEYFITAFISVVIATILSVLFPLRVLKKSKVVDVING